MIVFGWESRKGTRNNVGERREPRGTPALIWNSFEETQSLSQTNIDYLSLYLKRILTVIHQTYGCFCSILQWCITLWSPGSETVLPVIPYIAKTLKVEILRKLYAIHVTCFYATVQQLANLNNFFFLETTIFRSGRVITKFPLSD